jgi:protein-disulfide isomerase
LPRIEAEYIKVGKVRFVFRHLAVLGPLSERAAEGVECAGEQGKFWTLHDRLFEKAGRLTFNDAGLMCAPRPRANPESRRIGLDVGPIL